MSCEKRPPEARKSDEVSNVCSGFREYCSVHGRRLKSASTAVKEFLKLSRSKFEEEQELRAKKNPALCSLLIIMGDEQQNRSHRAAGRAQ